MERYDERCCRRKRFCHNIIVVLRDTEAEIGALCDCVSVCVPVCLPVCPCVEQKKKSVCLCPSVLGPSVRLSVCPSVCLSVCLSVFLSVVCLSVCLSVCRSVCLSVCLSASLLVIYIIKQCTCLPADRQCRRSSDALSLRFSVHGSCFA